MTKGIFLLVKKLKLRELSALAMTTQLTNGRIKI